jgi:outer membrane protein OmpA-like peptidoglycan-associated protein
MELSQERAMALQNFMVRTHGISADRFDLVGYGETRPAVPNDSPENRALNRRAITITIME